MKVTTEETGASEIESIRIAGGVLVQTSSRETTTTYTLANNDESRGRTMILEHPKLGGWTLVKPENVAEETDALYRFEAELEAGAAGKVAVVQTRTERSQTALVSADADSETAKLVEEVGCGLVLPPGRPDLVAGVIRDVVEGRLSLEGMGERGRAWVEREADRVHQDAIVELFDQETDPIKVIKWKEIFDILEAATDRCEDVGNLLEGVVVKHG